MLIDIDILLLIFQSLTKLRKSTKKVVMVQMF